MSGFKLKKYTLKALRIAAWIFASLLLLFLIVLLVLQFSSVQTYLTGKITSQISSRVDTPFTIDEVAIRFPKSVGLKGIYVEDEQGDTLLYAGDIYIDVGMFELLKSKVEVNSLDLSNVVANMKRLESDTVFNFQFLINAFTSDQPQDTTGQPSNWEVQIEDIDLDNIHFHMDDHMSGLVLDVAFENFDTDLGDADILNEKYHVGKTRLSQPAIRIQMHPPSLETSADTTTSEMPRMDIALESLHIDDYLFDFVDSKGMQMNISGELIDLEMEEIALHDYLIGISSLDIENMMADFNMPAAEGTESTPTEDNLQPENTASEPFSFNFADIMDWTVRLGEMNIAESSFQMIQGDPSPSDTFDPQDISMQNINLQISDVLVSPTELKLNISEGEIIFSEQFRLAALDIDINMGQDTSIEINELQTGESQIAFSLVSPENFLRFNEEELYNYTIELEIPQAHIKNDLSWLVPTMDQYYFNWPGNEGIALEAKLSGHASDLDISGLQIEGPGFFAFAMNGTIKGLPDIDNLVVDIPNLTLDAEPKPFLANLPDSLQPAGIGLPDYVNLETSISGSLSDFTSELQLNTDLGNISLQAQRNSDPQNSFSAQLSTREVELGEILMQTETFTQPLDFDLEIEGTGLKPEDMNLDAVARITNLKFNNYSYDQLRFDLQLKDSVASVQSNYSDDNLAYSLDVSYGIYSETPEIHGGIDLKYAQLDKLGFSENNLLVKTDISADMILDVKDFFNGNIEINNSTVASEGEVFEFPDFFIQSQSTPSEYNLELNSQLASFDYIGNISPVNITSSLKRHISYYFTMPSYEKDTLIYSDKYFELQFRLYPDELITDVLISQLESYDTLKVDVSHYDSNHQLTANITWPGLDYGSIMLDDFTAEIVSDHEQLNFDIGFRKLDVSDIAINEFNSQGNLKNDTLAFGVGIMDRQSEPLYTFEGLVSLADSITRLSISPQNLLINGEQWDIPQSNQLALGPEYLWIEDFFLNSEGREISIQSRQHEEDFPIIDVGLEQIDLGKLTDLEGTDTPTLSGVLNGELSARNFFEDPAFVADLRIESFGFKEDTIGNIIVKAENIQPNVYDLFASIQSNVTDLVVEGNYRTGDNAGINFDMELNRLDLSSFESFAAGSITELEGFLTGEVSIRGTTEQPVLDGSININQTSFHVTAIDSRYTLKEEKIVFDRYNVRMQDVRLEDQAGRTATISGNINIKDLNQIAFNLGLRSQNFLLMDVTEEQNENYHGRLLVDSDLTLSGDISKPTVNGTLRLNEGSNFTLLLPQSDPEAIGDEGVVEFMQTGDTLFHRLTRETENQQEVMSAFNRLDLSINLEIDRDTDIRLIIDEYAGDFLEVEGGGVLSLGIDPGGRITLSGRYEMEDGEYLLTFYDVIRRNFRIQPGSNIVWTGDPMDANVDIAAIYTLRTSAQPLMVTHMAGDQGSNLALRQQFPFRVYLKMSGNLMEPEISFELELPEEHSNAFEGALMARINQINQNESELNKQVFALLILGNFIQDNPFASMGGGDLSSTARSSASQILTQQLNKLSDRYIKGVDINFEVQSGMDYSGEEETGRTQVQMEVSRNFFDERVKVTVGGNIELEDESQRQSDPGDIAGDFKIEYLITPEGSLRLVGFRTKNWEDIFDGEVYETGISLIFTKSYNQFRELFRKEDENIENEEN